MKSGYLLSTGEVTDKVENYLLDLFRLYLAIYPGDVPGNGGIGFNFIFTDVKKDEVVSEVKNRVSTLVEKLKSKVTQESGNSSITVTTDEISVIDETRVKVVLTVNEKVTDDVVIDIYNNS